jgi:ribonuclease HI
MDWAYTDGSCKISDKGQTIGAGVFKYAADGSHDEAQVSCATKGITNTINRAELAGIAAALELGHTHIATDSAAAQAQIWKAVHKPNSVRAHVHARQLQFIANRIRRSPAPICISKVKAHSGVIGNEGADILAQRMALGIGVARAGLTNHNPDPFPDLYWPAILEEESTQPHILPDLGRGLKQAAHEEHRLGSANRSAIYYKAWCGTIDGRTHAHEVDLQATNHMWQDSAFSPAMLRTILRCRMGVLYNQKHALRFGHAPTSDCPACGQPDSAGHMLLGCEKASKLVTSRHHGAGRLILKSLLKGSKGAGLVFADVGSSEKLRKEGLTDAELRKWPAVRDWLQGYGALPRPTVGAEHARQRCDSDTSCRHEASSRPDAILAVLKDGVDPTAGPLRGADVIEIKLIEIKYCSDTLGPKQTLETAKTQHADLMQTLQAHYGTKVQQHTILLGIAGSIYMEHTTAQLRSLGLNKGQTQRLTAALHRHAAAHAVTIVGHRRKLGAAAGSQPAPG